MSSDQAGPPARPDDDDRCPGQQRPAREDPVLHRHRQAGRRRSPDRRRAGQARRRAGRRLLLEPTVFDGHNKMRMFQEEIFGPVLSVTTFKDEAEALTIANDTLYGLGAGVWTRDGSRAFRMGRGDPGRPRLDQLLPPLPGPCRVRRLQAVGHRPREPQDDARPLPADQEPAGQLQPESAGLLLTPSRGARLAGPAGEPPALSRPRERRLHDRARHRRPRQPPN